MVAFVNETLNKRLFVNVSNLFHDCFSQLSYHSNTIISVKEK
jgi:hypothetical protein